MKLIEKQILKQLDEYFVKYDFPILENTNIDFVSGRLIALRSDTNWAIIFNWIVWWPSADGPSSLIYCFGNCINDDKGLGHRIFHPVTFISEWSEHEEDEIVKQIKIGKELIIKENLKDNPESYIHNEDGFRVLTNLLENHRESMLASDNEYKKCLTDDLTEIIVLDDWYHGNCNILPSQNETFIQLAKVLATGNKSYYKPTNKPNTYWKNWLPK